MYRTISKKAEFFVGAVLKVEPGFLAKRPYYVEVLEYNPKNLKLKEGPVLVTQIPGGGVSHWQPDNWEQMKQRFTVMGDKELHGHLLYNQNPEQ